MELISLFFFFIIIVPSAIIHEYAHGWAADMLGDPTARLAGRLTLNPAAHIDPMGTFLLPLLFFFFSGGKFLFAYAKPVPYNPYNLRDTKWGPALIGAAGPAANFAVAVVFGMLVRLLIGVEGFESFVAILSIIVYANVLLAVFNLVPIPPLDGSKILFAIIPDSFASFKMALEQYGFFLLLFFVFFLFPVLYPVILWFFRLFSGIAFPFF